MKNIYHYLFYKLYSYLLRTPNKKNALDGAVAFISLIVFFIALDLFVIIYKFILNIKYVSENSAMICGIMIGFSLYLINTIYFKKHFHKIKEEFDLENNIQKWIGSTFVIILGIVPIGLLIIIGLLTN